MNADQFLKLSKEGENSILEYKTCTEKVSESLYETVCSFLNHSGGKILLGVKDDGEIIGINPEKVLPIQASIIATIKNTECFLPCPYFTPQIIQLDKKIVLLLEIPCGQYVYRYNGRYWDRNGDADIDVTDHPALLLSLFERKNPHLFEERIVDALTLKHLDDDTFRYCRNILAVKKPNHLWLQLSNEDILLRTRLAKKDEMTGNLGLKYAALILFGKDEAIEEFMPRYRFEALFHMCSYAQYNDLKHFPNRYDDRRTMRCNLIKVYNQLTQFTERYLPDKFYLPLGSTQREDLRWELFREVIANLCVHADYSTGFACYYHVFQDRVLTKNPTRLLAEIPEGVLTLQQLNNYTKNPLLVRVFHELSWVEDMGSGTRNILRYAPLYYSDYKVEIISGSHFIFSITYMKMSPETSKNVTKNHEMSPETSKNVTKNYEMSPETSKNVTKNYEMSQETEINVLRNEEMSQENDMGFSEEDLQVPLLAPELNKRERYKKNKRQQGIVGLIRSNSKITVEELAEKLDVNERTIHRDMEELKQIVEHVGPTKGGYWRIKT
ncbi:MAG: putative DNA binding domain-containing protein [Bacteroidales bacterium]|nr:putative DNA binding domain-containing protein [Bacteroidales bacterium]